MKRKILVLAMVLVTGSLLSGCSLVSTDDLEQVQKEVDQIVVYDDTAIKTQITTIEATLESLSDLSINDTATQVKITALQESVTSLTAAVDTINTTLNSSQETEILARLELIETSITSISTDLLEVIGDLEALSGSQSIGQDEDYSYIYDSNGDYISVYDVMELLIEKYIGPVEYNEDGYCEDICFEAYDNIYFSVYTREEIDMPLELAKMILMYEELYQYKYYYKDRMEISMSLANELSDEVFYSVYFRVPASSYLNDDFSISVHEIFNKMYDVRFNNYDTEFVEADVQAAYDTLVALGTYSGFVLDIE